MAHITRRRLVTIAGGGLLAAGAGAFAAPHGGPSRQRTATGAPTRVTLLFRGGYGLVRRRRDDGAADLLVVTARRRDPACGFLDHKLLAIVRKGSGDIDPTSSLEWRTAGSDRFAELNGDCTFSSGMDDGGVRWPALDETGPEPHVPDPNTYANWNNLAWLHQIGRAPADFRSRVSRTLLVTGGVLAVLPPLNPYLLNGRWRFEPKGRPAFKKALTDVVSVSYDTDATAIRIASGGQELVLRPANGVLTVEFQHAPRLSGMDLGTGRLEHMAMLYSLVGDAPCEDRPVPIYEDPQEPSAPPPPGLRTPGDLCPPVLIEG